MKYRSTLLILASLFLTACAGTKPYVWNPDPWPHAGRVPAPGEHITVYTETELHETAVHEAAHAVATAAYYGADVVTEVHIHLRTPDGSHHDHIGVMESNRPGMARPHDVQPCLVVSEIGAIAEHRLTSNSGDGGRTDLENANDTAWLLYEFHTWHVGRWRYDRETAPQKIKDEVALEIKVADACSKKMVDANEQLILDLADLIMRQPDKNGLRSVHHDKFVRFMKGRHIEVPCP